MILHRTLAVSAALVLGLCAAATAQSPAPAPGQAVNPALIAGLQWRLLGPFRAGWASYVTGVPTEPDTFYFGGAGGGVWKTTDAGRTWASIFDGPAPIGALAVAPSNPNIVYAGTGQAEVRYDTGAGGGVFKSTDGGAHWTSLGLAGTRQIGAIWVDPKNPELVMAGAIGPLFGASAERGLFRSADGGKHWVKTLDTGPETGVVDIAADPGNSKRLFAAAWQVRQYPWLSYFTPAGGPGSKLYQSGDGGVHWTVMTGGGWPDGPKGRISLAVARLKKSLRIYATIDAKKDGGLWRSDDGGAHWLHANKETVFSGYYSSRITIDPRNPDVIYTTGQSIRRCEAGGARCTIIKGAPGGDDYHDIWFNPLHPERMINGSDQGAVVTVNGGKSYSSWYNQPTGQFYHLATDNRFPYWIYSAQQDSGTVAIASRSDYGALTYRDWHPVGGEERDYDIPDPADPDIVYGSGLGGAVTKWDAKTGQVQDVTPYPDDDYGKRPTTTKYRYLWMTPLAGSRTGTPAIYEGAQVLFRTTDHGAHWQTISPDLTGTVAGTKGCEASPPPLELAKACGFGVISAIEPSARQAGEIWVGTDDGLIQLTRDGGAHWRNITPPDVPLWGNVHQISVSSQEDGVAYATVDLHRLNRFEPFVLRTRDYGAHWTRIDAGLPSGQFASVVRADPVKPGLLYAGTDSSVYVSFDDGGHWQSLKANLPAAWVTDLAVQDGDLIAATEGRAIWVLDDVTPLRQIDPAVANQIAHLFTPRAAFRVHPNNNKDTPLPPEEPQGQNPPAGAIVDYWLGRDIKGPVTLEIRDAAGALIRRFASDAPRTKPDGERYFAKAWTRPLPQLSAAPGAHRFVWNLRYPRPLAMHYGYEIAAVYGLDTPLSPEGAYVLPGDYTLTLTAAGASQSVALHVSEDPRIAATPAGLQASLGLSQKITAALLRARTIVGEHLFIEKALTAKLPGQTVPEAPKQAALHADGALARLEAGLESADAAPTQGQEEAYARAVSEIDGAAAAWQAYKDGPLAKANAVLTAKGGAPITIPPAGQLSVPVPDDGDDLP